MEPLTEPQIRAAFVNCSKGEAKRLAVPKDLATRPWPDLDFFGWRDPQASDRAYLAIPTGDGLRALALRCPPPSTTRPRRSMCAMCLTTHTGGVSLMVAARAGKEGKLGNTVGTYLCADLSCSLYLRGLKDLPPGDRLSETLSVPEKAARTTANLAAFLAKVTG
ncbi:FBP domain-containing protein [Actinokineospora guangxiensis]|uniref:FBP domain-containing protein n=1 Tax=Actinokineospora guangxiensis TaxID=1490288 RepID=A0ABW0EYW9_9PSEU